MKLVKLQADNNKESWRLAQDFLLKGKIIICPTDTLYGFSALANKASK